MEQVLDLDYKDSKGVSKRSRLEQVELQTGHRPEELELKSPHGPLFYLYQIFWDCWERDAPFWQTIYYYQTIMDMEFTGEELAVLRSLFATASSWLADKERKSVKKDNKPVKSPKR